MAASALGPLWCSCVAAALSFLAQGAAARLLLRAATAAETCGYEFPAQHPAGADADAMRFIERAYDEGIGKVAHLPDHNVSSTAARVGPRGPTKCSQADGDGNCRVATCREDTYGEITQRGAAQLFADPLVNLRAGDTFMDLGSGLGKLVADAAILAGASRSIGVELSDFRWSEGCKALGMIASNLDGGGTGGSGAGGGHRGGLMRHMELRRGNMLHADVSSADVVYVASLCFRPGLMEQLRAVLARKLKTGARVASLRRFPSGPRLVLQATLRVPMDWSAPGDPQPVFVYKVAAS